MNTNENEINMRLISSCFLVSGPEFNQQRFIPFPVPLLLTTVKAG